MPEDKRHTQTTHILFILYTNEYTSSNPENDIVKFSDDTTVLGVMYKDADTTVYRSEIQRFVKWCDEHHLILNVKKTEEMVFDPKSVGNHVPVVVHNANIAQLSTGSWVDTWTHGQCIELEGPSRVSAAECNNVSIS